MTFLIGLLGTYASLELLNQFGLKLANTKRERARLAIGIMFVISGLVLRIINLDGLTRMVPDFVPNPEAMVIITGGFEVLGGIALLLPYSRLHRLAGLGLSLLLIPLLAANINVAINQIEGTGFLEQPFFQWLRLPMQAIFIGWTLWASGIDLWRRQFQPKFEG